MLEPSFAVIAELSSALEPVLDRKNAIAGTPRATTHGEHLRWLKLRYSFECCLLGAAVGRQRRTTFERNARSFASVSIGVHPWLLSNLSRTPALTISQCVSHPTTRPNPG